MIDTFITRRKKGKEKKLFSRQNLGCFLKTWEKSPAAPCLNKTSGESGKNMR